MKKILIFLSLFTLISITPAQAASNACSSKKVGQVLNESTCKKVGGVYRWYPNLIVNTTSITTSTIIKQEPVISGREKVFNQIKLNSNKTIKNIVTDTIYSNNISKEKIKLYSEQINDSLSYWDPYLTKGYRIDIKVITEKDDEFFKNSLYDYKNANFIYENTTNTLHEYVKSGSNFTIGGNANEIFYKDGTPTSVIVIWSNSKYNETDQLKYIVAHEITHAYQILKTIGTPKQNFNNVNGSMVEGKIYVPCNLFEGTATLFGAALSSNTYNEFNNELIKINYDIKSNTNTKYNGSMTSLLNITESWAGDACFNAYAVGSSFYEWTILNYGISSYINIFDQLQNKIEYDIVINNVFKTNLKDLYSKSENYVLEKWNG